jgi:hypothetical protein
MSLTLSVSGRFNFSGDERIHNALFGEREGGVSENSDLLGGHHERAYRGFRYDRYDGASGGFSILNLGDREKS